MLEIQRIIKENPIIWEGSIEKAPYNIIVSRNEGYILFKYNQIESDFRQKIVRESRGIILDEHNDYKVVCKAFDKFFNYGEELAAEINWDTAKIQEKLDGCLSGETKIITDKGDFSIKEICEKKDEYKVLTFNHELNKLEYNEIEETSIKENDGKQWFDIELENGENIKITGNHKVWLENLECYRRVDELKEGDEIMFIERKS